MKSIKYLILAFACFFLSGYMLHAGTPEPLKVSWNWPTEWSQNTNFFGGITLRDASTNYSFIIVSSPIVSIPVANWPVKFVIPASNVTLVASNWWNHIVMDDLTFSSFYAMKVTNHLNQTESDFSQPALWLPTPRGELKRLTK